MLTDAQVRKIKPLEKKKRYSDEKGLYLEVTPAGGRFWRLKYRFNGRESTLTIGSYP
ncbi:Arm DNA-binding domain-containing protein, partial [Acinetobacter baumannii]|nr:Arm DNA-binding domain-containing protein [Acinetobacter baumannii]